jgi:hypothetical protein
MSCVNLSVAWLVLLDSNMPVRSAMSRRVATEERTYIRRMRVTEYGWRR